MTNKPADFRPGDDIVFLLDRKNVTEGDVEALGDPELTRMASEWLAGWTDRFFFVVARNYQPVPESVVNTFDSHGDSLLFPDKAALLAELPNLARLTGGSVWVILATEDVESAVRSAITAFKPN